MDSFEHFFLPKTIQKALEEKGITQPTPIQSKSFQPILSGRDILGIAQTGTGKTLAYLLPVLREYQFSKTNNPKILILVPTRELVVQVAENVSWLTQYMSIRSLGVYGGVNINTQKKTIAEGVDLIVGTPGRIMDLSLDGILRLDEVKKLIIDEFDEMLDLGFSMQITSILSMLKPKRQNIMFSATMTDSVDQILSDYFNFPEEISLAPSGTPLEKISQHKYNVPNFNTKINLFTQLMQESLQDERILVFVNDKKVADLLHLKIEDAFPNKFGVIHSNKSQNYRLNTIQDFRNQDIQGIITTDIMARGLDISDITYVINFEIPEVPEKYIHRIGRTGRADKIGNAISFVSQKEEEFFIEIELMMDREIEPTTLPNDLEISDQLLDFEKVKTKFKALIKTNQISENKAFHEKKDKNKKVNLGGPGKRNPKKTKPTNRGRLKRKN